MEKALGREHQEPYVSVNRDVAKGIFHGEISLVTQYHVLNSANVL